MMKMVCDERALTIAGAANGATMAPAMRVAACRRLNLVMAISPRGICCRLPEIYDLTDRSVNRSIVAAIASRQPWCYEPID
jgi:hypothetical protein